MTKKKLKKVYSQLQGNDSSLRILGIRVPQRSELYINKNGLIQRKLDDVTTNRPLKRIIIKEGWL
jgi:hypothetical protein